MRDAGGGNFPVLDHYGVIGEGGPSAPTPPWDFADHAAHRVITTPSATFNQTEWLVDTAFSPGVR